MGIGGISLCATSCIINKMVQLSPSLLNSIYNQTFPKVLTYNHNVAPHSVLISSAVFCCTALLTSFLCVSTLHPSLSLNEFIIKDPITS